tara:strand:+ start:2214 stop:4061 length:1848 start_codon:yes stop_codon:yes gene_type:complete
MFHNKAIANKNLNKRIKFLSMEENYVNRTYNHIIGELIREQQYDKYYVVNSDMLFYDSQMNVVIDRPYAVIMEELVDETIKNHEVMSEITSGKALLIFDFGSEIAELSTDDTTMYGIINQHFKDIDCTKNVVYWTMYESPFDIVDESECAVNIVSASLSTLRYISFKYNTYEHLSHNNLVAPKSAMYLNRRIRSHRSKLLVECLRREVDLDDMHFSYMGSDEIISMGNEDVSHNIDLVDLLTTKVDEHQISKSNFKKVVTELYGKQIAMEDKDIVKWLGSSKVGRVMELFNHRAKSKFEIITEYTSTENNIQISEKLSLAMLSKMPFVVLGDKGYMNHLKELGFKTFDKFWSEDYDRCEADERIKSLGSTILDIQKNFNCELDEYDNWIYNDEMKEILEHNYLHYKDVYSQTLYDRIVKSVSKTGEVDDYSLDLINKVWYNEVNDSVFVAIPGNEYRYFETMIASDMQYKLMNRKDIPNLETLTAYVAIRSPYERMQHQMFTTSLTVSGIVERYKDTGYMKSQSNFAKGLNIKGVVDLSEIHNQVIIFGQINPTTDELLIPQPLVDLINYFYAMPGIEPDMEENMKLTDKEKEIVYDLFKEDFEFYNRYGYKEDI